jgi:vibriolysin
MTKSRSTEQKWIRGALLALAAAGCQAGALDGVSEVDPGGGPDEPGARVDLAEALAGLPGATVLQAGGDGSPRFLAGDLGRIELAPAAAATATDGAAAIEDDRVLQPALPPILRAFGLSGAELALRRVIIDERGARHYRYDQRLGGLDVIGGDLAIHVDAAGAIFGANGTARGEPARAPGATAISEAAARRAVAGDARWADLPDLAIAGSRRVYLQTAAGPLHEAYELIALGMRGDEPVRDQVYVDAARGEVLAAHPTIQHALNRKIHSANHTTSLPGTLQRIELQAPTGDLDVDAAYDNIGDTRDAYVLFWNRDTFPSPQTASVHYSVNYCSAFWNGTQMVYGDGAPAQSCFAPARAVDVTAHELTHVITSQDSGLVYTGEPGGLNESYSDIFGAFVEAYVDGGRTGALSTAADVFLIGDTVMPPFFRSLCDPAADGASRDVWSSTLGSVDVHYSSGPNNLAFCLLAKGGQHPRGKTTNNVPAIGMDKAIRILYRAQNTLLTSSSNYATMRTAAILAAQQLGYDQATQDAVACAYAAISVGTAPAICPGAAAPAVLQSGVPVTGLSNGVVGTMRYWSLAIPTAAASLAFTVGGGTGDVDLYVSFGTLPTETSYLCRPRLAGNSETCTFTPTSVGTYYVGLRTYAAYSGVTLTGAYSVPGGSCGADPSLSNGVPVSGLSGAATSAAYWCLPSVPSGRTLTIKISGGTGDADLYTQLGARPTTSAYACRPYLSGNAETCTHTTTSTGSWYVMLRGFAAYSGVQLVGSY